MTHVLPPAAGLASAEWRTSSYSGGQGDCVEVADGYAGTMPVRDSKRPDGPVIGFSQATWTAFLDTLR